MSRDGFASPQNYSPGEWVDGVSEPNPTGTASDQDYVPGEWASGAAAPNPEGFASDGPQVTPGSIYGWRDILLDVTPPIIDTLFPADSSSENSVSTNISFSTKDVDGQGVDQDTINATVEIDGGGAADAIINGVFQAGWDGPGSSISANAFDGYDVVIDPTGSFSSYDEVEVVASCSDLAGNPSGNETWSFFIEDLVDPTIDTQSPTGTDVAEGTNVSFSTKDVGGSGVDSSTINATIEINGGGEVDAIINGAFQTGWDGGSSSITPNAFDGYDVVIDPTSDFGSLDSVIVRVDCDDNEGNSATQLVWGFAVRDYEAPTLQNLVPDHLDTGVLISSNVVLEIVDPSGVDPAETVITIEGSVAWTGDAPAAGFAGSKSVVADGYQYTLNPDVDFPFDTQIDIDVVAKDLSAAANTLNTSYYFETEEDVTAPTFTNKLPAPSSTGNVETSNVSVSVNDVGGTGVVQSTINMSIGGVDAIINGVVQTGFDGVGSSISANGSNGFDVVIDKTTDYDEYEWVTVEVSAEDNEGNLGATTWSWRVVDYLGPLVTPVDPIAGESGVAVDAVIEVNVTDAQSIDAGLTVEVDRGAGFELAFEEGGSPQFKPGFDGPSSAKTSVAGGYKVVIDPVVDFDLATTVFVRVTGQDPDGNPTRL